METESHSPPEGPYRYPDPPEPREERARFRLRFGSEVLRSLRTIVGILAVIAATSFVTIWAVDKRNKKALDRAAMSQAPLRLDIQDLQIALKQMVLSTRHLNDSVEAVSESRMRDQGHLVSALNALKLQGEATRKSLSSIATSLDRNGEVTAATLGKIQANTAVAAGAYSKLSDQSDAIERLLADTNKRYDALARERGQAIAPSESGAREPPMAVTPLPDIPPPPPPDRPSIVEAKPVTTAKAGPPVPLPWRRAILVPKNSLSPTYPAEKVLSGKLGLPDEPGIAAIVVRKFGWTRDMESPFPIPVVHGQIQCILDRKHDVVSFISRAAPFYVYEK